MEGVYGGRGLIENNERSGDVLGKRILLIMLLSVLMFFCISMFSKLSMVLLLCVMWCRSFIVCVWKE